VSEVFHHIICDIFVVNSLAWCTYMHDSDCQAFTHHFNIVH